MGLSEAELNAIIEISVAGDLESIEKEFARERERKAARIENAYYKLERAEDAIAHYTEIADGMEKDIASMQEELDNISKAVEIKKYQPKSPTTASPSVTSDRYNVDNSFWGSQPAILLFQNEHDSVVSDDDLQKMLKRKPILEKKIASAREKLYGVNQKIHKAIHEKKLAETIINAVA